MGGSCSKVSGSQKCFSCHSLVIHVGNFFVIVCCIDHKQKFNLEIRCHDGSYVHLLKIRKTQIDEMIVQ